MSPQRSSPTTSSASARSCSRSLKRLGVHCLDVPPERIGMELLNRYLLIKQRELI